MRINGSIRELYSLRRDSGFSAGAFRSRYRENTNVTENNSLAKYQQSVNTKYVCIVAIAVVVVVDPPVLLIPTYMVINRTFLMVNRRNYRIVGYVLLDML